ncbi:MAG: hypothetical protein WBV26_11180 [Candidatus Sulfotelmatobacter sp.]
MQLVNQASLAEFFFFASLLGNAVAEYDEQVSWSKAYLFHRALPLLKEADHRCCRRSPNPKASGLCFTSIARISPHNFQRDIDKYTQKNAVMLRVAL